ncbi:lipid A biosynthesis acyltransferase [Aquimarina sp. AD10]|uniref:Lipid A biosynthesis acyltransferase n=1 Tax=Aquimarina aggregata TaxID=1642818 RepID=A0A163BK78_9FLAO|nr:MULTISPECIES: lysophospholipid acyltransferase family protein [Aquimarina]AXT59089.1 lipid A biosynthesis acyltransferase [Aquimarina sp. AD10]KZS41482.1 lipid A biosynthesis acyltransferase [Aquimarina aggregata]RKM92124.1 lipid A biosynthesis acyltransferase [Aquimarina sp. AD10]
MHLLIYRLAYPIILGISKLPWRIFYAFSTFVYLIVYYIIRYRRTTVTENLTLVFPEKTKKEIQIIRKAFYKHMCDMFLEMTKSLSISREELIKRYKVVNLDEFHEFEKKNKSIITLMGHYGSFEWSNAVDLVSLNPCVGIYKQIKNKHFDKLAHRIRGRFNSRLIASHKVARQIIKDKQDGTVCGYGMISDQSPKISNAKYWTDFMGIKVPIFMGGEFLAQRLDVIVLYLHVEKVKRGHYEVRFIPISENSKEEEKYFVIKQYLRLLEKQIHKNPEYYLWTHKRWKHRNGPIPEGAVVD